MIQCAMTRLNEISNHQIPVSGESLLPNLLDSFVHSDSDSESFHGFTDSEIRSALRSLRGCAVLEDAETDAIEAVRKKSMLLMRNLEHWSLYHLIMTWSLSKVVL